MRNKIVKTMCKALMLSLTVGTMFIGNGIATNAQPKTMKDGTIFDAEYYAQKYADVVAVYGTEETSLFQHYTDYGRAENREAVETPDKSTFDAEYYASQNPDVVAVYGTEGNNLYQHYLQYGKAEGRKPNAFNTADTISQQTAPIPQATDKKSETAFSANSNQTTNSLINEKILRRGSDVTGWDVIQSNQELFKFPIEDCFETASGVYIVSKGWLCQMFTSNGEGSYGQHALMNLGLNREPNYNAFGPSLAQEGINYWKIS